MSEAEYPKERRLVLRLLGYWRDLCGERDMPDAGDIDGGAVEDWDYCFVIDLDGGEPRFTHYGKWHAEFGGADMNGKPLAELAKETLAQRSTSYLEEVRQRCIPITYGGELKQPDGRHILYRSILLPLSHDGETVSGIFGGANCKLADDAAEGEGA